jgi:hypothetical protein
MSQNLSEFRWKKRVIIISGNDPDEIKKQVSHFLNYEEELEERKIALIAPSDNHWKLVYPENKSLNQLVDSSERNQPISIKLIGLDGGIKLGANETVKWNKIRDLIDSMPMRQSELKRGH